jgi:hypothetical protein
MDDHVFSAHIRSRLDGTFDNNPAILTHLKNEIRRQLKKIGQWHLSPSYLAFDGESWECSDALDELVNEVYIHCIEKRLQKLGEHLAVTGTCDGSVRKKISWFLQDRQEKGNPTARRVFRNVRSASESLIEQGKAETTQSGALRASTIVLAVGQSEPNTTEELADSFSESLGDSDFVKLVSRHCPGSWRMIETAIEKRIDLGLRGYILCELAKIFTEVCKRPNRVNEITEDTDESSDNIWNSITEKRTDARQSRYLNSNAVDEKEQLSTLVQELAGLARENISNERIRSRTLRMIEKIAELVQQGEDVRELSRRKLATELGVSKSTLSEDMARLHNLRNEQDAHKSETES